MGFYPRHVVVSDAIRYGIKVLPVDLRYSQLAATAEGDAIRLGLIDVKSFGPAQIETIEVVSPVSVYRFTRWLIWSAVHHSIGRTSRRWCWPVRSIISANDGNCCGIWRKPIVWRNGHANSLCAVLMNGPSCRRWIGRNAW
jgi:hypothetical protein